MSRSLAEKNPWKHSALSNIVLKRFEGSFNTKVEQKYAMKKPKVYADVKFCKYKEGHTCPREC